MHVTQQPPIKVGDLLEGARYRLRVYSHEHHGISSESYTFETSRGEAAPHTGGTLPESSGESAERLGNGKEMPFSAVFDHLMWCSHRDVVLEAGP